MLPKFSQIVNRLYAFIYETNHSKSGLGLPSIVALVMVIDKSWTSLGKHEKAFYTGLKKFVDDCKPLVDSAGNIRCPCKSCRLVLWVSIKHLSDHISKYGFDPSYKTWIHHGEPDLPPPPPVIDNTRQPQMSDMTACLNDLSYIPLNNEQNEPTQGDIGETSNDPTQAKRNEFEELYASANEELYPGCDHVTRLDFMAKFTYFKVKGKLTDSIFNEMLEFFQNVFPTAKGYKLPPSYYAIKKTFKTIGLGYESIHACVNDCFLFRGDANKDVHFCPVCNTSRWKDSNTPGKKVPKKVLRYFPIIPRLQRLYKSSHTAKEMTWHATGKCTEPGKMQHPVDGRAWKDFDTKYLDFAAEPRNVRLGLAADGFNPFGNLSQSYSMWPVILTTYNLPPWLCMKESSFMLTLLIPGPKSPGKDIDVYLRPLIDDLKDLWAKPGVETIDVATGLKFNMRAMVLSSIMRGYRASANTETGTSFHPRLPARTPSDVLSSKREDKVLTRQVVSAEFGPRGYEAGDDERTTGKDGEMRTILGRCWVVYPTILVFKCILAYPYLNILFPPRTLELGILVNIDLYLADTCKFWWKSSPGV
ncbi:hypothetical protein Tco_0599869 [Tanacetum coccineum]